MEKEIWFAAGCFWGAQKFFKLVDGVLRTEVGFVNGFVDNPTYEQVYKDDTGYAECVHIVYDSSRVSLAKLAGLFLKIIDPLSLNKQGEDEGTRYRTGAYYKDEEDLPVLKGVFASVTAELGVSGLPVELGPVEKFYTADEYHQDYLDKNPGGYCHLSPEIFTLAK
ncbi:MAG: peptide-methionine (S)-S-oxide reductase MsrA [Bacteroidales bacterium]|nr:peptide-methionine (S)-S-oxide reductase MsrA [Bacteroidales bacterium]